MITDICIVFGCGRRLTRHEKLCGNKCTTHSCEEESIGKAINVMAMELDVLVSQLENDIEMLRTTPRSKSAKINRQRKAFIISLERPLLRLKKLHIRLTT